MVFADGAPAARGRAAEGAFGARGAEEEVEAGVAPSGAGASLARGWDDADNGGDVED